MTTGSQLHGASRDAMLCSLSQLLSLQQMPKEHIVIHQTRLSWQHV